MDKDRETALERDQLILNRLARIEHRVDSIDQTSAFSLRVDASRHLEEVKKIFRHGKRRAQIYLAADGLRSVLEIAKFLGMKRQNVGPDLKFLSDEGLLEMVSSEGNRDIWAKKSLERTLRISKYLCDEYGLKTDGRVDRVRAKKKVGKKRKVQARR